MKTLPPFVLGAALCSLCLLTAQAPAQSGPPQTHSSPDTVSEGLNAPDWFSIRQRYEAQRHAVIPVLGGYQARNPGHQWQTRFDGRGFLTQPDSAGWQWGLELRCYGFPGHEQTVAGPPRVTTAGQRLTYDWDATLQEWFVNDQRGLEHGFTVKHRPLAAPALNAQPSTFNLLLAVRGGLRSEVQADGRGVSFVDANDTPVLTYSELTVLDADGRKLPARFEPVAGGLRLAVDERGAHYPLTIDPIAQQAYLKASNTRLVGGNFAQSVAVSGDTVVIGAVGETSSATGVNGDQNDTNAVSSGAAYVFVRSGTNWTQQAYLKASNSDANDFFGISVAVSGDTIVIGADFEASSATEVNGNQSDNSAPNAGAAYVFVRNGTNWTQQAYLKASNAGADDMFGKSVAVSGDTVVVGSAWEASNASGANGDQGNNGAPGSGAAYIFVRGGTNWTQQAYLKASNTDPNNGLGWSVAVSGNTVVIGSAWEASNATGVNGDQNDNSALGAGAAYVFVRSGANWAQQAYLKASNTEADDQFGTSVAVSGDTVVVGSLFEDSNARGVNGDQGNNSTTDSGAAYVFVRSEKIWSQQAYFKASNTDIDDKFGGSLAGGAVALSGDTVVVGALGEDSIATGVNGDQSNNIASHTGAAYIFSGLGSGTRLALTRDGSGGYVLSFNGVADLTYRLERARSVLGPWSAIVTNTAPASGLIEYHESSPPPGTAFYRTALQ